MEPRIKQYVELITKEHEVEVTWLRQILTLAAGALALLAGLGPDVPSDGLGKYLLATTWAGLGLGIVAGAAATYIEVNRAKTAAIRFLITTQAKRNLSSRSGIGGVRSAT